MTTEERLHQLEEVVVLLKASCTSLQRQLIALRTEYRKRFPAPPGKGCPKCGGRSLSKDATHCEKCSAPLAEDALHE